MVVNNTILNPPGQDRQVMQATIDLFQLFGVWLRANQDKVKISYFIPERGGFGWYVVTKDVAFDFELNRSLVEFSQDLIRKRYPIHAALLPGSVSATVPADGIALHATGGISVYAD